MIMKYSENFNDNIFDDLNNMDKFLERYQRVKLTQEEMNHPIALYLLKNINL